MTDKFELCIIELSKIEGKENLKDKLLDWLYFLENPKSERVTKIMEENEAIKEAVEKVNTLSEDEEMQRLAYLREKGRREKSAIYDKGMEEGIKKEVKQIAKKLKEMGISVEDIKKATNLSKDEIEKL